MNIYLLSTPGPHAYDTTAGFVVRADDENSARMLAATADRYSPDIWLSEGSSKCVAIGKAPRGLRAEVLLTDFRAG